MREYPEYHLFEVEPRVGMKAHRMIVASKTKAVTQTHIQKAADEAVAFAHTLMADDEDGRITSCGIYHSHPSPGPVRRFTGEVKKVEVAA